MDKLDAPSWITRTTSTTGSNARDTPPPPTFDEIVEWLKPTYCDPDNKLQKDISRMAFNKARKIFDRQILPKYSSKLGLSPPHLVYIRDYFASMITEGNTVAFSLAVCLAMGILYQQKFEPLLLQVEIDANTILDSGAEMRVRTVALLAEVMATNGGNYAIIQDYLFHQQEVGSSSDSSQAVKFFLYSQIGEKFKYFIGNRARFFFKGFTMEQAERKYFAKTSTYGEQTYIRSMIFYKAFTAIGLGNLLKVTYNGNQIPLTTDHDGKCYICVARAVRTDTLEALRIDTSYPFDVDKSEFSFGTPKGIADSASLGDPPTAWVQKTEYETHRMAVPISNFFAVYFLSPELCREGEASSRSMVAHPNVEFSPNVREAYKSQRELICDMSTSSPVKVISHQLLHLPQAQSKSKSKKRK
ncbi:MAG: hypothetical protein LBC30_02330 [Puniceicoccales bacterium]|jgi:hypothetical protein|nr:hypothetical protein [Puniceicoccales bacterium]